MRRQQVNFCHCFQCALIIDIEQAQAVDLIIEKVDAIGLIAAHREQVEQGAARGVFAVLHDLINMTITRLLKLIAQPIA